MSNESVGLLQRLFLGGGARATAAGPTVAGAGVGASAPGGFAGLLRQAQAGALVSERPVTIGREAAAAGVQLNAEQIGRVSAAADKAEVSGVRSALVLIDGQALRLDIASRSITGAADVASGVVSGIDGLINLSPNLTSRPDAAAGAPFRLPFVTGGSASLASLLEQRENGQPRAA